MNKIILLALFVFLNLPPYEAQASGAIQSRQEQQQAIQQQGQQVKQQHRQAVLEARQQAKEQIVQNVQAVQESIKQIQKPSSQMVTSSSDSGVQEAEQAVEEKAEEVVDITKIWQELEYSSHVWLLMIDDAAKEVTIKKFIEDYALQRIYIRYSAYSYIEILDRMFKENADLLNRPFKDVLMIAAILEYDFDNGQDKDALALTILGNQNAVDANKYRLGLIKQ